MSDISATLTFLKDPSKPGGYDVKFDRDAYPSMGVYMESPSGFITMKEDREKTHSLIKAFRILSASLRSTSQNTPPPDNPNGCLVT